jgi:hypothetical protein
VFGKQPETPSWDVCGNRCYVGRMTGERQTLTVLALHYAACWHVFCSAHSARSDSGLSSSSLVLQGLDTLLATLLERAQPKTFKGQFITGSALATFAQVMNMAGTWKNISTVSYEACYESLCSTNDPLIIPIFLSTHAQITAMAPPAGVAFPGLCTSPKQGRGACPVKHLAVCASHWYVQEPWLRCRAQGSQLSSRDAV